MSAAIHSYRDLEVWRLAMDLTDQVYHLTDRFPTSERFGLTSQLRRAVVSIPSNIAEGWGRGVTNEYVQFLRYARASLYEAETQVMIAQRRGYVTSSEADDVLAAADRLGRMLLGLVRALRTE